MKKAALVFALAMSGSMAPAVAQVQLEGWFIALGQCEAYQSKNALTNPGDVFVVDHVAYEMIGINKTGGDWYQVRVPDAPVTASRWVSISCGVHVCTTWTSWE